jgi:hypothetical protein
MFIPLVPRVVSSVCRFQLTITARSFGPPQDIDGLTASYSNLAAVVGEEHRYRFSDHHRELVYAIVGWIRQVRTVKMVDVVVVVVVVVVVCVCVWWRWL